MGVTSQFVRSAGPLAPMVASSFLADYRAAAAEREALGIPALPLTAAQAQDLTELLQAPPAGEEAFLLQIGRAHV